MIVGALCSEYQNFYRQMYEMVQKIRRNVTQRDVTFILSPFDKTSHLVLVIDAELSEYKCPFFSIQRPDGLISRLQISMGRNKSIIEDVLNPVIENQLYKENPPCAKLISDQNYTYFKKIFLWKNVDTDYEFIDKTEPLNNINFGGNLEYQCMARESLITKYRLMFLYNMLESLMMCFSPHFETYRHAGDFIYLDLSLLQIMTQNLPASDNVFDFKFVFHFGLYVIRYCQFSYSTSRVIVEFIHRIKTVLEKNFSTTTLYEKNILDRHPNTLGFINQVFKSPSIKICYKFISFAVDCFVKK